MKSEYSRVRCGKRQISAVFVGWPNDLNHRFLWSNALQYLEDAPHNVVICRACCFSANNDCLPPASQLFTQYFAGGLELFSGSTEVPFPRVWPPTPKYAYPHVRYLTPNGSLSVPRRRRALHPIRHRARLVFGFVSEVAYHAAIEQPRAHRREEQQNGSRSRLVKQNLSGPKKTEIYHGAAESPRPQVAAEVAVPRDVGNPAGDALPAAHIGTHVAIETRQHFFRLGPGEQRHRDPHDGRDN